LDGNVGIGTLNPDSALHIYKQTNDRSARFQRVSTQYIDIVQTASLNEISSNGKHFYISSEGGYGTSFNSGGFERMRINPNGNVGIGTSSPGVKLDVVGSTTIASQTNVAARIGPNVDSDLLIGSVNGNAPFIASEGAYPLTFFINAIERMRIDSLGRVGIGTASPAIELDLHGNMYVSGSTTEAKYIKVGQGRTGNGYAYLDLVGDATNSDYGARFIRNNSGPNARSQIMHRGTGDLRLVVEDAGQLVFYTSSTERMRITSTGSVGIGTAASKPASKLNVAQGVTASSDGAVTPYFQLHNANAGTDLKRWRVGALSNGRLTFDTVNDAYSAAATHMFIASTGDITFKQGVVNLESASGNPAQMNFYCESGNAHYTRIQSSPHASYSGNVVLTLPTTSGTLATTASVATTGKSIAMAMLFG
jgi:hypothetical protein